MLKRILRIPMFLGAMVATCAIAPTAFAQGVQLGFCPGPPGHLATVTIEVVIACPLPITLTETATAPCDDAAAMMAAVDAAMAAFNIGGTPIFGPPSVVAGGVGGQLRHEYPFSLAFLFNTNCDFISISIKFDCGTMGMAVNAPPCHGCPGIYHPALKLSVDGPPPPGPSDLAIKFAGCPIVIVHLLGTESAAGVRDKVLAALLAAGYAAHVGTDGSVVVDADCHGSTPLGIDEYGVVGGLPMRLDMGSVPRPVPTEVHRSTWGSVKASYR